MMTDERQGSGLFAALEHLPRGAGLVFRHYGLAKNERRRLFMEVRRSARRRQLLLMLAGPPQLAAAWGADGSHGLFGGHRSPPHLLHSAPAHDRTEIRAAEAAGAHILFVSPVFATQSHPAAAPLGRTRFGLLTRDTNLPIIALGGMNGARARSLAGLNVYGWAAIDAWR